MIHLIHGTDSKSNLTINWSKWLDRNDTILSVLYECSDTDIVISAQQITNNAKYTNCMIEGGEINTVYKIYITITTFNGLIEKRLINVKVIEKPIVS